MPEPGYGPELFDLLRSMALPAGQYAVFGSGPLLAKGIIDSVNDLDVICLEPAWEHACEIGNLVPLEGTDVMIVSTQEGAINFGRSWAYGAFDLADLIATADIGYWGVILSYVLLVIVMGTILDSSSIMLLLVPLLLPVITAMGVDLVWLGIVTILAVELGLLTPPFGISVFVIKSALDDPTITLGDIFIGAAPFALMMLVVLGLVLAFPILATALI